MTDILVPTVCELDSLQVTGETTWDFPTEPAIANDSQNELNHVQMGANGGGQDGVHSEGDDGLPPG